MEEEAKTPVVHSMIRGDKITPESILKLFEVLTGRRATPEEREEVERKWADKRR